MIQKLFVILIGSIYPGNRNKDPLLCSRFKHICIRFRLHNSGNQLQLKFSFRKKTIRGINLEFRLTGVKTRRRHIVNSYERHRFSRKGRILLIEKRKVLYHITSIVVRQSRNQLNFVFAVGFDIILLLFAIHQIDTVIGYQQ